MAHHGETADGDAPGAEDTFARAMRGLPSRVARAARLERRLYTEVRSDRTATAPAVTLVALLGLAHGLGGIMRGLAFGWNPVSGALFGLQGEIVFFVAASLGIYLVGRYALGATVTYGQVLRPLAFSTAPGFLILVATLVSLIQAGAEVVVLALILAWRLAAGFVAVRQALGRGGRSSLIVLVVGFILGAVAVGTAARVLVLLLDRMGVSS